MIATLTDWLLFLLAASLKGSVLLLVALALAWRMRRFSAASRHAVIAIGVAAFLMVPFAQLVVPRWSVAMLPSAPVELRMFAPMPPPEAEVRESGTGVPLAPPTIDASATDDSAAPVAGGPLMHADSPRESSPDWSRVLVIVWLTGAALIVLRLLAGIAGVWLLERRATMITDGGWLHTAHALAQRLGLTRGVTLLRGDRGSVPLTWGVLQPVVWLPADASGWDDERRVVVLAHELAHVKRRDAITQWIANITLALHWFNPLAWIAARQLRAERERACDEAVLRLGTHPSAYAEHLLAMVRSIGHRGGPAAAMAMARRSQFEGRLLAILDDASARRRIGGARLASIAAIALLLTIPLAALSPAARATAADLPGIAAEAGGYPAALNADTRPPAVQDDRGMDAVSVRERRESVPVVVHMPTPGASARSTAAGVLRDSAAAGQVLTRAAAGRDSALLLEIIAAAGQMSSSSDRAIVLTRIARLPSLEPSVLAALLNTAKEIPSSDAKAGVLRAVVTHHPTAVRRVAEQYLAAAESISSSTARASALMPLASTPHDAQLTARLLQTIGTVPSSTERVHLLRAAIRHQPAALGAAAPVMFAVIDSIASSTDRAALLRAILQTDGLSEAALIRLIQSAARIPSSTDKAHLLVAVARRVTPTGAVKTAFLEATNTISSESARVEALSSLLPPSSGEPPGGTSRNGAAASRASTGYSRYVARDTTQGVARETVLTWQNLELRNGEIVNPRPRARLELEEVREVLDSGRAPERHRVIVTMVDGKLFYDYCIDDVTQTFAGEAPSWLAARLRAAERAQR